jgi:glycosyltransferase involved in cell wall biosynthesis
MTLLSNKALDWLIIEDALKDYQGHWFEYLNNFYQGLTQIGDRVTILSDHQSLPFIREQLPVLPILPASIWHRMGDNANPLIRYMRVPIHAWQTVQVLRDYLAQANNYDVIFVPTVLVHHLLAWTWLIKRVLKHQPTKIILFFPNAPVNFDATTRTFTWSNTPTTKLLRWLFNQLKPEIQTGKVILGAETDAMQQTLSELSGVPFTYFPHPVLPLIEQPIQAASPSHPVMGSYGPARHEKGSDILFKAIAQLGDRAPHLSAQFILQCLDGFDEERKLLNGNPSVTWITRYFQEGEYASHLSQTDILLLPYRPSSYALRVSRVVIEAMVNGIPVIASRGTTLAEQAQKFGAAILCEPDDSDSLADAIVQAVTHYEELKAKAAAMTNPSQAHFSIQHFRQCFLNASAKQSAISTQSTHSLPLTSTVKVGIHT